MPLCLDAHRPYNNFPVDFHILTCFTFLIHTPAMSNDDGDTEDLLAAGMAAGIASMIEEEKGEEMFHYDYNDTESGADLVVQTNDDVRFRVHSYYLKAAR